MPLATRLSSKLLSCLQSFEVPALFPTPGKGTKSSKSLKLHFLANCSFFGQSFSLGHYPITCQPPGRVNLRFFWMPCQVSQCSAVFDVKEKFLSKFKVVNKDQEWGFSSAITISAPATLINTAICINNTTVFFRANFCISPAPSKVSDSPAKIWQKTSATSLPKWRIKYDNYSTHTCAI